ncbi:MBL fold metallo-hydrolase [Gloeocapsa sp. PCC 73106]|uniref:MBL fold metallo-hydrolase n=1 Tax=Gloeocapsa sp. PCC 73106 TaxID=102232 RepID=UPI0002ACCB4C|nr:MBL fold metallo-hydrolase [Gloeocapsa sp. PCC 73106]ELR99356.1 Zn-dependent hydrolase, glyoxylase [Gloeocapsa sp. PCC 73106]
MLFRQLFDQESSTYTYLIASQQTQFAILVDPVLEQVARDVKLLTELGLKLNFSLETHVHADHVTGTSKLRSLTNCHGVVPEKAQVQCADRQIKNGETLMIGEVSIKAIATPGHTDSHMTYLVGKDRLLTGDCLLIRGCGRTDFQSGDPGVLFDSITQKLFTFPDTTLVYPGHDYRGQTVSTIGEEKAFNPRLVNQTRESFINLMNNLNLPEPQKMSEAVPANRNCGNV